MLLYVLAPRGTHFISQNRYTKRVEKPHKDAVGGRSLDGHRRMKPILPQLLIFKNSLSHENFLPTYMILLFLLVLYPSN